MRIPVAIPRTVVIPVEKKFTTPLIVGMNIVIKLSVIPIKPQIFCPAITLPTMVSF